MDTKQCRRCGLELPLDAFSPRKVTATGKRAPRGGLYLLSKCKKCACEEVKARYRANYRPIKRTTDERYERQAGRHGTTVAVLDALKVSQGNKCAVCPRDNPTHIDHDHNCCPGTFSCGKCIRGLLCNKCNTGIGMLNDDVTLLQNAVEYLLQSSGGVYSP